MMHRRDPPHALINLVRDIIKLWSNDGNQCLTKAKRKMESKRFKVGACANSSGDGVSYPRAPWTGSKADLKFVDQILPLYVRLPKGIGGKRMPHYITGTITIEDAMLFLAGLGKYMLSFLQTIQKPQRTAFNLLFDAVPFALRPVCFFCRLFNILFRSFLN